VPLVQVLHENHFPITWTLNRCIDFCTLKKSHVERPEQIKTRGLSCQRNGGKIRLRSDWACFEPCASFEGGGGWSWKSVPRPIGAPIFVACLWGQLRTCIKYVRLKLFLKKIQHRSLLWVFRENQHQVYVIGCWAWACDKAVGSLQTFSRRGNGEKESNLRVGEEGKSGNEHLFFSFLFFPCSANDYVGFGLMDARQMVELASNWTTVPPKVTCTIPRLGVYR